MSEFIIGLTGGVASGKSTVERAFQALGVFVADAQARRTLEAIVHPRVRASLQQACGTAPGVYAIASIPLLAEGGGRQAYPWLGRVLVVDVPEAVQLQRLLARDGIDEALARTMIDAQATRRERLAIADDVLVNDGPLEAIPAHVEALDRLYRRLAESSM